VLLSAVERLLLHEFLGYENVTEHAGKGDDQDHLQDDADTGDITAGLTERTTQQGLHYLHLQIDIVVRYVLVQPTVFKLENTNLV
jgi:hypothetical protein